MTDSGLVWPSRYTTPALSGRFRNSTRRPNTESGQPSSARERSR
jgi:hypothetical protein